MLLLLLIVFNIVFGIKHRYFNHRNGILLVVGNSERSCLNKTLYECESEYLYVKTFSDEKCSTEFVTLEKVDFMEEWQGCENIETLFASKTVVRELVDCNSQKLKNYWVFNTGGTTGKIKDNNNIEFYSTCHDRTKIHINGVKLKKGDQCMDFRGKYFMFEAINNCSQKVWWIIIIIVCVFFCGCCSCFCCLRFCFNFGKKKKQD